MKLTYKEMLSFNSIKDRYEYLRIGGLVGEQTFGSFRYLNQKLYLSDYWRKVIRPKVIIRDNGMDLACEGFPINGKIIIHHLNPITMQDVIDRNECLFDLNNLVCVSNNTHQAIHYGYDNLLPSVVVERYPNDTCPWKR